MTPPQTRVMITDDDPIVRSALKLILGGEPDFGVVGEASNGRECLALLPNLEPDLVLMDLRMPVMDGIETTERIRREHQQVQVLALTTFDTDDMALAAITAGAAGFLLKDTPPPDLIAAVRAVLAGEPVLAPTATRALLRHVQRDRSGQRKAARDRLAGLTDREREVALAIAEGLNNADIADRLYLSVPTIKTYVSRILERLEAANRVQIAICVQQAELDTSS